MSRKRPANDTPDVLSSVQDRLVALPDALSNHMTRMLTMREFLQLRGASSELYERITFRGDPTACLARLRPGLITHVRAQRGNRLAYLGLRLTLPPTDDELAGLAELRGMRGIKGLELDFVEVEASDVVFRERIRMMTDLVREAFALELESLTIKIDRSRGILNDMVTACVLANHRTLRHFSMPTRLFSGSNEDYTVYNMFPDKLFLQTIRKLESLRINEDLAGLLKFYNTVSDGPPKAFWIESSTSSSLDAPSWRYLDLVTDEVRVHTDSGAMVPFVLPDTLEGLALSSHEDLHWVCPPKVSFLRIYSIQEISMALCGNVPYAHSALEILVLDVHLWMVEFRKEQRDVQVMESAYAKWLENVSLPALHTIVLCGEPNHKELVSVARFVARIPHLRDLYINVDPDPPQMHMPTNQRDELTPFVELLAAGLSPQIRFH
jgi:hypothetical protein